MAMHVSVVAINDAEIEPVSWSGSCSSIEGLRDELRGSCDLARVDSIEFKDEAFGEWAEALDLEIIPQSARLRLRGWRVKGPAAKAVQAAASGPPPAAAQITLEGTLAAFEAAGGARTFQDEMQELIGTIGGFDGGDAHKQGGRVEVVDVREGSVIVTFKVHASPQPGETSPAVALARLQAFVAKPTKWPTNWAEGTQMLSKTRPATLQVVEIAEDVEEESEVATEPVQQISKLDFIGSSEDEDVSGLVPAVCLTPRAAVPSPASAEHRAKREKTYEMLRFYTERAEPMLAQRYRSDEMVLRRWYNEHPAGIKRAQQWGSSRPTTDAEWDAKIGEIIDKFLQKADRRKRDRNVKSSTSTRAVFVELDKEGRGWLDAAGISELSRRLGRELIGRPLQEAVDEMSSGGASVSARPTIAGGEDGDGDDADGSSAQRQAGAKVMWEDWDCWFRLQEAIDGLDYPENMYASYMFEDGSDPRHTCRGHLPNMVSLPPECSYRAKLLASKDSKFDFPHRDQVYKDVPRTFSNHPQFATEELRAGSDEIDDETGRFRVNWRAFPVNAADVECGLAAPSLIQSLQNVLMAVVAHSPNGYTQGMNYVAATLLLHRSEEEAFDWLCRIVELYPGLYAGNLWGTRVETGAIDALLAQTPVGIHMARLAVPSQLFTTAWILPLFCSVMQPLSAAPSEPVTVTVLQHLIALEGRAQNTRLARLSLALFKMHEARLLATRDAGELMELVPRLPSAFCNTPQGTRKRLVGMLALAQSDDLVSDSLIVATRSQQRREVAAEARRRTYMQETLAMCKTIEADTDRSFDVMELLARVRLHNKAMKFRGDRKLKVRDTAQPQMGAVHVVIEEGPHADAACDDGHETDSDEDPSSSSSSWEAQARSLFSEAAAVSKADDGSGTSCRTVTLYEFCSVCEKMYKLLEPAHTAAEIESGGAALRPWLSAPSAAELQDIADMENWLTTIDSVAGPGPSPPRSAQCLEPEPEPELELEPEPAGARVSGGDADTKAGVSAESRHENGGSTVVEVVEAHPYYPEMAEGGGGGGGGGGGSDGLGWLARWRCCVATPANALPPLAQDAAAGDATVIPEGVPPG